MTPTEELRAMLDERGIKWWPSDDPRCEDVITHWQVGPFKWTAIEGEKDLWLNAGIAGREPLTPEQAIVATLGAGTCEWCKDGKTFDGQTVMMTNHGWQGIRHCPNCGRRLLK